MSRPARPFTPADQAPMHKAATILLVRDGTTDLEVFMMKRASASDFGGMFVFPGGKVDAADSELDGTPWCSAMDDALASRQLSVANGGITYWVAALRECFEECGVLLAYDDAGELIDPDRPQLRERFAGHQQALRQGTLSMHDFCAREVLHLALDRMNYFSHWITPEGPPRRYDTRFFISAAVDHHQGQHDEFEAVDSVWITPADALVRRERGELQMIYPTITTLESIRGYRTVEECLAGVRRGLHLPEWTAERGRQGMQKVEYPVLSS